MMVDFGPLASQHLRLRKVKTIDGDLSQIIREQIAYYEARAHDWDTYSGGGGPYPGQHEKNLLWFRDLGLMKHAVSLLQPHGQVLELAAGTGFWTEHLANAAERIVVLDSSMSMLSINEQRCLQICARNHVSYRRICCDLFKWKPEGTYDTVFFAFWLCHIPEPLFDSFWDLVSGCLKPSGRFIFLDSVLADDEAHEKASPIERRELGDGTFYRVIKIRYSPEALEMRLRELKLRAIVKKCGTRGLLGVGGLDR